MVLKRFGVGALLVGLGLAAAGCTDGYGYTGLDVGYANPYYGYGDYAAYPGYGGYGFGWYGDYYYPGTGIYVYDRFRRPYRWNDNQRRYWEGRRGGYRGDGRGNWDGFAGREGRPGIRGPRPGGPVLTGDRGPRPGGQAFGGDRGPRPDGQRFDGNAGRAPDRQGFAGSRPNWRGFQGAPDRGGQRFGTPGGGRGYGGGRGGGRRGR